MYEVRDTGGLINRYRIDRNGYPCWFTTTLSGAMRWIGRDKLRHAKARVPQDRKHPIVWMEQS